MAAAVVLVITNQHWLPAAKKLLVSMTSGTGNMIGQANDKHADHGEAGQVEENSLELSDAGRQNVGLPTARVELRLFEKTIGIVAERPGRSQIEITAPITGVVT